MTEKPFVEEIRLFGKWSFDGIEVKDVGLVKYINLRPHYLPHSGGRHEHQRFRKSELTPAERLANQLMRPGASGGKKARAIQIVKNALEIVALKTGKNPLAVLIRGIENSAPCEDTTRISYGGIAYHVAVDVAPQRRIDLALRFLVDGARRAAVGNVRTIDECLADEIIAAGAGDAKSYAVSKRDEQERVAAASR